MKRKQQPDRPLESFAIYDHPRDYPDHFVVRRWVGDVPTCDFAIADTLDAARAEVPDGLYRIPCQIADDPVLVEVWL